MVGGMSQGFYTLDPRAKLLLADLGVNTGNLLRRAGLPSDALTHREITMSIPAYHRFWEALEEEIDAPALPLRIAEAISAESFGPAIFAALCSASLNEAALRLQRYKPIVGPIQLDVDVTTESTTISCRWPHEQPPTSFALAELLFWQALARIGTRTDVRPSAVETPHPPSEQDEYVAALGVPVRRGDRHAITFRVLDAARPFLTASDAMWEQFEPTLRTKLAEVDAAATTAERVRAALVELLPAGKASVADVGRAMAVSTRTLQRKLGAEGTTFQAVLARTREALARHYLAQGMLPTDEIAFLLGYTDPSSFHRAYRDWTGESPERARTKATA